VRILVHDYSGHAFPVQLSRALAARGHTVHHVYFAGFQSPKGGVQLQPGDPAGLSIEGLTLDRPFAKYSFVTRLFQERAYGRRLAAAASAFRPEVVLSGNSPLDPQAMLQAACRGMRVPFVFWLQDIYGVAIDKILRRKLSLAGGLIGAWFTGLERRLLRRSARVVAITQDFVPILEGWGVARDAIDVVENWAPIDDLPALPRDNAWAARHGLAGRTVILYSGTLGLKHDPALLLELARRFAGRDDIRVVVVSEGLGADWLCENGQGLTSLMLLPFQPYAELPSVLASADLLAAILEPDAGIYSVPSKVLSYYCAGRPILAAIPPENLAARTLLRTGAGVVVPPGDRSGFAEAAARLAADPAERARMAKNALDYARSTFDIAGIGDRFETILRRAAEE